VGGNSWGIGGTSKTKDPLRRGTALGGSKICRPIVTEKKKGAVGEALTGAVLQVKLSAGGNQSVGVLKKAKGGSFNMKHTKVSERYRVPVLGYIKAWGLRSFLRIEKRGTGRGCGKKQPLLPQEGRGGGDTDEPRFPNIKKRGILVLQTEKKRTRVGNPTT